jgi:hypothetical protein
MANTITATLSLAVSGLLNMSTGTLSKTITPSADDVGSHVQSIGTSEESVFLPASIATAGMVVIKNLNATTYVQIGLTSSTGVYHIRLLAGESCLFRPDSLPDTAGVLYVLAKANTAAVDIQIWAVEA